MGRNALAESAGIDPKTIYNLEEKGKWPIARVRAAIEKALGWPAGEMKRISDAAERQPAIPESLRRDIMSTDDLTLEERQAVIAAVEETLAKERAEEGV